jgi:hypothetical protein
MANQRRSTARPEAPASGRAGRRGDESRDPGAFIGRLPERATETIPGGLGPKDQRVSAVDTRPGARSPEAGPQPEGHREGPTADDDTVREAGQDR